MLSQTRVQYSWHSSQLRLATRLPTQGQRRQLPRSAKQRDRTTVSSQARQNHGDIQTVSVSPTSSGQSYLPQPASLGVGAVACLCLLAAGRAASGYWKRLRQQSDNRPDEFLAGGEAPFGQDSLSKPDYQAALARTRQAVSVQKALQYKSQGSPARAMVELRRALQENSTVREPLLNARQEQEQLYDLYKMHLQNTEVPAEFSTLLQLREMLAIDTRAAENLEEEALQSGAAMSI